MNWPSSSANTGFSFTGPSSASSQPQQPNNSGAAASTSTGFGGGGAWGGNNPGGQQQQQQQQQQPPASQSMSGYNTPTSFFGGNQQAQSQQAGAGAFGQSGFTQQQQQQPSQSYSGFSSNQSMFGNPLNQQQPQSPFAGPSSNPMGGSGGGYQQSGGLYGSSNNNAAFSSNSNSGYSNYGNQQYPFGSSAIGSAGGSGGMNATSQGQQNSAGGGVPRYMTGYLTGGTFAQSSPRTSMNNSNNATSGVSGVYDSYSKASPEQQSRELVGSGGTPGRGLFASTTSSAGTGGARDSNLALAARSRTARSSSGDGDYMEEDAPPTDSLAEFDDEVPAYMHAGSSGAATTTNGNASKTLENGQNAGLSASPGSQPVLLHAASQGGQGQIYKITVFGFPSTSLPTILQTFETFSPIVYNSTQPVTTSAGATTSTKSEMPPSGANWVTIGYEHEWAALRALRKNGEVVRGNIMIGVKWADGSAPPQQHSSGSATPHATTTTEDTATSQALTSTGQASSSSSAGVSSMPRSATSSALGQPATVKPANKAYLNPLQQKQQSSSSASKPSAIGKIADLGRLDAKIFKEEPNAKPPSGIWGTISNLVFGF